MHHNGSTQVTTNPASWLIFEQMLTIAARKVDSYFNDVAVVDAACMSTHNPADRFYWMIDQWGSHWGAANLAGIERMRASIKVFGYRDTLEYYIYDPRAGLVKSTKELMDSAITEDALRIATGAAKPSTALPLPIMPKRLLATVKEIRAKDAALNHESHGGRYFFEETMIACPVCDVVALGEQLWTLLLRGNHDRVDGAQEVLRHCPLCKLGAIDVAGGHPSLLPAGRQGCLQMLQARRTGSMDAGNLHLPQRTP